MGRGLELALTLVVVGGFGWIIDRIVGTYPLFTVIFSVAGFAGITVKLWLGYDLEMRKLDQDGIWSQAISAETLPAPAAGPPVDGPVSAPLSDEPSDESGTGR